MKQKASWWRKASPIKTADGFQQLAHCRYFPLGNKLSPNGAACTIVVDDCGHDHETNEDPSLPMGRLVRSMGMLVL